MAEFKDNLEEFVRDKFQTILYVILFINAALSLLYMEGEVTISNVIIPIKMISIVVCAVGVLVIGQTNKMVDEYVYALNERYKAPPVTPKKEEEEPKLMKGFGG